MQVFFKHNEELYIHGQQRTTSNRDTRPGFIFWQIQRWQQKINLAEAEKEIEQVTLSEDDPSHKLHEKEEIVLIQFS